jgi:predicted RNA-binding Zn ribbon-like protein
MAVKSSPPLPPAAPLFIADDLALDFVNTAFGVGVGRRECLGSDAQVLDWLRSAGLPSSLQGVELKQGALLEVALALRESARKLVEKRKAGVVADATGLNQVLASGSSYLKLLWSRKQPPVLEQHRRLLTVESLLVPVAEAVAALLARGDFELVRACESSDCTLWFYDRTKSHRRRWCSMAVCGNRLKVAAFRARRKSG